MGMSYEERLDRSEYFEDKNRNFKKVVKEKKGIKS
jgi:hypothetical protein